MKTQRWSTTRPAPIPFRVVDARGVACGQYRYAMDAERAKEFLNEHGNHAPYTIPVNVAPDWKAAS